MLVSPPLIATTMACPIGVNSKETTAIPTRCSMSASPLRIATKMVFLTAVTFCLETPRIATKTRFPTSVSWTRTAMAMAFPTAVTFRTGTSQDCNANGIPDECELGPDCNGNGVPDQCDIDQGTSSDCDRNGVPDECDPDCDEDGVPDAWMHVKKIATKTAFPTIVKVLRTAMPTARSRRM